MKLSGMPQHIVQRGINREPCFFAEEDYQCYLHWLWKSAADWRCDIHAYVLMTNHVHLLMTPRDENAIAKLMQSIGRRYVQYINHQYKCTGTLWEGRYKSSLIQAEDYLLACMRYIELNPVRAGIVEDPVHYPWSSYRTNGHGKPSEHLIQHPLYHALGKNEEERAADYRKLFRPQLEEEAIADIRQAINQSAPLGNDRFKDKVSVMTGVRRTLPKRGRPVREKSVGSEEQIEFGF
jgi:putative transposase